MFRVAPRRPEAAVADLAGIPQALFGHLLHRHYHEFAALIVCIRRLVGYDRYNAFLLRSTQADIGFCNDCRWEKGIRYGSQRYQRTIYDECCTWYVAQLRKDGHRSLLFCVLKSSRGLSPQQMGQSHCK